MTARKKNGLAIAGHVSALVLSWLLASEALACPACAAAAKGGGVGVTSPHSDPIIGFYPGDGKAQPVVREYAQGEATYDLGEAGAAQTGSELAILDQPGGYMIGDFVNNPYSFVAYDQNTNGYVNIGDLSLAGGDRRMKISENNSPIPRDRIYFTFNHFKHALVTANGREMGLNRYTFGGEKTFLDGLGSVEVRAPFAHGLAATQIRDGISSNEDTVFGNVSIVPKLVLASGQDWLVSAGVGINLPTASNSSVSMLTGDSITVQNDATHLLPFLGVYLLPTSNTYVIGYLQADFDTSGNDVTFAYQGTPYARGVLQDQSLLHADLAIGHWIYRNDQERLTGIAPQIELHYTTTLQGADSVPGVLQPTSNRFDLLTVTGGINFQFFRTYLTIGCAVPLRGGSAHPEERPFDVEGQVLLNRFF